MPGGAGVRVEVFLTLTSIAAALPGGPSEGEFLGSGFLCRLAIEVVVIEKSMG